MIPIAHSDSRKLNNLKENIKNIPTALGLFLILGDVFSIVLAQFLAGKSVLAFKSYFATTIPQDALYYDVHTNLFLILGIIMTAVLFDKGLYTSRIPWWSQVQYLTRIVIFSLIAHGFLSFALKLNEPRSFIIFCWFFVLTLMIALRITLFKLAVFLPSWKVPTVIISEGSTSEDLLYAFHSDLSTGYVVRKIFIRSPEDIVDLDIANLSGQQKQVKICYGQEDHCQYISDHPDNFFVISLDTFRDTAREDIIRTLNESNVPYAIVPTLSRANLYQMEPKYFFGHDVVMLHIKNSDSDVLRTFLAHATKRVMDIVVSGILLLFIVPVVAVLAACLKIEGQGGTVFYGGRRIGKNNQFFNCWKLRSMEPDSNHLLEEYLEKNPDLKEDWDKYRKLPKDPRVTTRTARFLRKASLDELPQIWNIFVGDMSLVGPRPILEDEVSYFEEDTLKEYLSVRPGLTGLWQVSGRNKTSFKRRIYWDSWYVRNWSLWGDIVILIKTPIVLLTRKGAS